MIQHTIHAFIESTGRPITLIISADHELSEEEIYLLHPDIDICDITTQGAE